MTRVRATVNNALTKARPETTPAPRTNVIPSPGGSRWAKPAATSKPNRPARPLKVMATCAPRSRNGRNQSGPGRKASKVAGLLDGKGSGGGVGAGGRLAGAGAGARTRPGALHL